MDPDAVAKAFVEHYYSAFDMDRSGLGNLYQDNSMLTFEGEKIQGNTNIVAKLVSLPFTQCKHAITTVDCQPSGPAGGMLVFVSGNLQLAGEQHCLRFSQVKHQTPSLYLLMSSCVCSFRHNIKHLVCLFTCLSWSSSLLVYIILPFSALITVCFPE